MRQIYNTCSKFSLPAVGSTWEDYNNASVVPAFFNADLTVMFTDETERNTAIGLCYQDGETSDPDPTANRECYFDYLVIRNDILFP